MTQKKKDNFWWWVLIAIGILIPSWIYTYVTLKNNAKYTVGYTTKFLITKGHKKEVKYKFSLEGKEYRGTYLESSMFHESEKVIVPNGKYIVVYSSKNPEISSLLAKKPVIKEIDLDSLSKVPVAEEDINWKRL